MVHFYDKTDGVTIETALTITNERITLTADTDAGSAPTNILDNVTGATSGTSNDLNYITGNDAGMMQLELTAADTNRLGRMFLSITDAANHVPVFHEFMVLSAAAFDWMFGSTIPPVNATQFAGQTITAAAGVTLPSSVASTTNITAGTITTTTNLTNLPAITANWLTAAGIAAGALDGKGNWNIGKTGYALTATTGLGNQTADITGSLSGSVGSVSGAVGSVTGAVGSVTGSVGSVTGAVGSVTGAVGSVTGLTASDVGAIKAKTDSLTFTAAGTVDANVQKINDVTIVGDGGVTPFNV